MATLLERCQQAGPADFYDPFRPWLFDVEFIPAGLCEKSRELAMEALSNLLCSPQRDELAAFVLEPMVQGASGMRMMQPDFVAQLVNLCRQHGILVIFDEVMTGFGRTGSFYAADQIAEHNGICRHSLYFQGG